MKSFKYLLVLPFAITALASCNKGNFSPTSYEKAVSVADNYVTSIKNSKASSLTVSGHINKINVKGDMTWWSYEADPIPNDPEPLKPTVKTDGISNLAKVQKEKINTLWSLIPNFSVKNAEIKVDEQDLISTTIPGSIANLTSMFDSQEMSMVVLGSLPKFPMNHNLLKVLYGIDGLKMKEDGGVDWDNIIATKWDKATVSFYQAGGRLKVTIDTDDIESFVDEIEQRIGSNTRITNDEPKKYPASFYLTTNEIGYIDSLGIKFSVKDVEGELKRGDAYYMYVKGDLEVDLSLTFAQKIAKPITIKYQLCEYRHLSETETPDIVYCDTPLKLDKVSDLTTSLDDFKEKVTFDWFSNIQGSKLTKVYDDPIFGFNYWKDGAKNVAFTDEAYDALVVPTYNTTTGGGLEPKCTVLGAFKKNDVKSLVTTSINGRVISDENGFKSADDKILATAADTLDKVSYTTPDKKASGELIVDEIFINSNLICANDSEYIISVAIGPSGIDPING